MFFVIPEVLENYRLREVRAFEVRRALSTFVENVIEYATSHILDDHIIIRAVQPVPAAQPPNSAKSYPIG